MLYCDGRQRNRKEAGLWVEEEMSVCSGGPLTDVGGCLCYL